MDDKKFIEGFLKGKTEIAITEISNIENLIELIDVLNANQYEWNDGDKFCLASSMYSKENSENFTYTLNSGRPFGITYSEYGNHCCIAIPCVEFLEIMQTIKCYLNNW